jgi:hypothetical protein
VLIATKTLNEGETFGRPFRKMIPMGSALARARVKHRTGAGRSGLPGLPRHGENHTTTWMQGACRRVRTARPFGRVIPLHSSRPCPCYPVSPTGRVAAQRCALTQPHKENDQ